jgi:antagonist of KipI
MLRIESPGLLTTVQDLGRSGQARFGVAPGGALDRASLILGNRLLGNEPGDAALEITLIGPAITFTRAGFVALTGADLGALVNGQVTPRWEPFPVQAGDRLTFDQSRAVLGARAYLCLAGGIDVEPVLGGRGTDLIGGFGGWQGRPLRAGDELPVGSSRLPVDQIVRRRLAAPPPELSPEIAARVVLGPQQDRFTPAGIGAFLNEWFGVTARSNRQGIRLNGPPLEHTRGADLVSEGIAHGAVQVPGDGQPIVLLAARQTVGGYVKIATVAGADLDRLGQLRPHDRLRFEETSVGAARQALLDYRSRLGEGAIVDEPRSYAGAEPAAGSIEQEIERVAGRWDPDGVIRVIEAVERAGVTAFGLEAEGVTLRLRRDGGALVDAEPESTAPMTTPVDAPSTVEVTAPVLGTFYRKSTPDAPPLVEIGARVEVGQTICVLEVMKTYHEVTANAAGTLTEFLVEDGEFVEYGQAIARIAV